MINGRYPVFAGIDQIPDIILPLLLAFLGHQSSYVYNASLLRQSSNSSDIFPKWGTADLERGR
jgi:hypothetical protein